jgi:hypothetical protein
MPRLAAKANIEKRVHAHGLRHTHASELAREGVPMNVIQAQLGHSNLGTTSRYLAHIAPAEVIPLGRFARLLKRLDLDEHGPDCFHGGAGAGGIGGENRLFGGLVAAQAVMAACHVECRRPWEAQNSKFSITELKLLLLVAV